VSLIQDGASKKEAAGDFTLDDFRKQLGMMAKIGDVGELLRQMPGIGDMSPGGEGLEEAVKRLQGIIDSMTKQERRDPDIIDLSRQRRIAVGSGTEPHEVKQFLGQFDQVRTLMQQMAQMPMWLRLRFLTGL
jgi:signal recognition particle subunit SRP54